ncbi:TPA: helix-turn-helix transcriptional regulator [Streptococcus pyogenes]|uniref:helix-turn-helix domain-containing protein n=2 Tax=Streptococcus pyogenes TaxID=1314 RepID=UPI0003A80D40|nr:helix-turn-helix transcriptional regulator [Streptococcus pyogenes]MDO5364892.1 helix-turn-helix transcriptional regulator [Streptococcus dysgalactiae]HER4675990.1 helix-turn-helix transcriptional regulator [Streptococcus pyogenes NGAS346]HER4709771.1 helix-turn-helix transcriptional regulator [Streptococcus pyogenes NGAS330]VHE53663.1 helix-turn-helix family protein [Streptococcus pyogenes]VHF69231.1 helix-turn-helix family protein [Streptococcus pyogenes]
MTQITLKAARINAGYTLKQVAGAVGKNPQTISKYEKDSSDISLGLLQKLSSLYGVTIDNLFLGKKSTKIIVLY